MISLALTKGRIETEALALLRAAGYPLTEMENKGRKLIFEDGRLSIVLAKAPDVITYVERGVCDAGVVGRDTIMEHASDLYESLDLGFGKCSFALAGTDKNFFDGYAHKVIATKYPKVAKDYFSSLDMDIEIVKIEGSVELAPLLGLADAIVDIVETGATLRENGLFVLREIVPVSARLVLNSAARKLKKQELDDFIGNLKKALEIL